MRYHAPALTDPLDLEIAPGVPVRALETPEDCTHALMLLENDMAVIRGQIARSEENPDDVRPGWRTRAQGALRWKKLTVKTVRAHAASLHRPADEDRRKVLLSIIKTEVGQAEFDRLMAVAATKRPDLFEVDGSAA